MNEPKLLKFLTVIKLNWKNKNKNYYFKKYIKKKIDKEKNVNFLFTYSNHPIARILKWGEIEVMWNTWMKWNREL